MTDAKEVEQSCQDRPELINDDPAAVKDIEMEEEKSSEDKKEDDKEEVETEPKEDNEEAVELDVGDDEQKKNLQHSVVDVSNDCGQESHAEGFHENGSDQNIDSPVDENGRELQTGNVLSNVDDDDPDVPAALLKSDSIPESPTNDKKSSLTPGIEEDNGVSVDVCDSLNYQSIDNETNSRTHTRSSPCAQSSPLKVEHTKEEVKDGRKMEEGPTNVESKNPSNFSVFDTDTLGGGDSGTVKEQVAFIMELHEFCKERGLKFKPPKFYGEPLNLLKLWRAVLKMGGYDKVTACKYWRQVGKSFKPPRSCTTISWTFRLFYEKALLDYERYRISADGTLLPPLSVPMDAEIQAPETGRARRDSAARAMQGWNSQRSFDNGEVSNPITKDMNSVSLNKNENPLKNLGGILKRKNPPSIDEAVKSVQMKLPKIHSDATVIDIGSPADWVKINVRATKDCFEVYALVPGLLREEVRVQSDPAGRLVISGEPEDPDNPWNVTPFKKVVSLPSRIDPYQTSAVVTLHGQLFVRVPFEDYD